jgi:outer membrane protein assembly factor BamB
VEWTASVSGAVEAAPTRHGKSAYLATRNGLVYRVDTVERQSQLIYDAKDVSLSGYGASPAVADEHVYLAMVEGKLQRVSLETKEPVWSKPLKGQVYAPLTLAGNVLLVGENEGHLSAWDAPSGELLWEQRLPGEILNRPVVSGQTVIVTTVNGYVAAYSLTGEHLWEFQPGGETALGTPLVADGRLYLVSAEGDVHVYALSDRKKLWGFEVNSEIRADPVLVGDLLLVGALDGNLYAVREGRLVDKLAVGAAINCTPAVDGNRVFLLDDEGRISRAAIEDDAFKLRWRYELLSESGKPMRLRVAPLIIDDMVLVASESGELSMLRD